MLYLKPVACVWYQQGDTWAGGRLGGLGTPAFCDHRLTKYLGVWFLAYPVSQMWRPRLSEKMQRMQVPGLSAARQRPQLDLRRALAPHAALGDSEGHLLLAVGLGKSLTSLGFLICQRVVLEVLPSRAS